MTTIKEHLAIMRTDIQYIKTGIDKIEKVNDNQNVKIDSLEKSRDRFKGAMIVIGLIWTVIVTIFNKYIKIW